MRNLLALGALVLLIAGATGGAIVASHNLPKCASTYHYRVVFKPQTIIPNIDFRGDLEELKS